MASNIEDFEMSAEEARESAIEEFSAMGADLSKVSGIVKDSGKAADREE